MTKEEADELLKIPGNVKGEGFLTSFEYVRYKKGEEGVKTSFFLRIMMRYFLSVSMPFRESPRYWKKNYDFGELEASEFNEKEKYVVLQVKNFKFHPVMCIFFAGYFLQTAKFVIKSEKITIEETKCMFKGDPYHEYIIRWK